LLATAAFLSVLSPQFGFNTRSVLAARAERRALSASKDQAYAKRVDGNAGGHTRRRFACPCRR
jgi:hypothetical protein